MYIFAESELWSWDRCNMYQQCPRPMCRPGSEEKHCHNVHAIMVVLWRLRVYVCLIRVCVLLQVAVKDRMVQVRWLFVSIDRHETILIFLNAESPHNAVSCVFQAHSLPQVCF